MNSNEVQREILWNLPPSAMWITYLFLLLTLCVLIYGIYTKVKFALGGKKFKDVLPEKLQWGRFFQTLLLQGKTNRKMPIGFFHSLVFFSFLILLVTTTVVALDYDFSLGIFKGYIYAILSFLSDLGGLFLFIGTLMFAYRRLISRPIELKGKSSREIPLILMLLNLVIVGFALEAIRIYLNGFPPFELSISPIGYGLAVLLEKTGSSYQTLSFIHQFLWYFHMISTMVFIAMIPYTKFFHIFLNPFMALITTPKDGGVIKPMDFENEDAETFGLGKVTDLTTRNRFELLACLECGRCTNVCPANASGKILDPQSIITKTRDYCVSNPQGDFWENPLFQNNELDACTTCGACMEECPANIEHVQLIIEAKRYKVLTMGEIPPSAGDTVNKIKNQGNPWGISQEDRFKWADGLNIPVIEVGKKVQYLYYVGCAGSYDSSNQEVTKKTIAMLKKAGVDFAVMGKSEKCNGDPIRRFGDEYSFYEVALDNIANINQYEFEKIIVQCPHCLHTIGKEYAKFEDGKFEVIHHTELLAELIKSGKLTPHKRLDLTLTFHDPCYLGRHHGQYSAPRDLLKSIPGVSLKEMDKTMDKALCCGMGGGNMWYELPEGEHLAKNRLRDIGQTQVPLLATACSYCLINFNSTKVQVKQTEELKVNDVACILADSVLD